MREVQKLLKELPKEQSELVKDIVPAQITVSGIQRVLQILLAERVSIRDLPTILEGIADGAAGHAQSGEPRRARARAAGAPALRAAHDARRLSAADRARRPNGSRPSPNRSSARATTAASPCSPRGSPSSSTRCARNSRTAGARGRGAGAGHLARHPAVRARHRRALPRADAGAVAGGDSPARAAQDGGQHLIAMPISGQWKAARPPARRLPPPSVRGHRSQFS